jgi:hypothetical protein
MASARTRSERFSAERGDQVGVTIRRLGTRARSYMMDAATNAPLFLEAFWEACQSLAAQGRDVPEVDHVNRTLSEHRVPFRIDPPMIVAADGSQPVGVPAQFESLDQTAQQLVHESFATAERLLSEGPPRLAVQEVLWLLETVSTAFRGVTVGDEEIVAKYFNKIAVALKKQSKGTVLEQALEWMTTMHGYPVALELGEHFACGQR